MATWPTTLPNPLASGYGVDVGDCTVRSDMESGAARVRRRFTAAPDKTTLRWVMTDAQMVIFRAFYESSFLNGAAWVFVPIRDARTAGINSRECRPLSPFKAELNGNALWHVEMPVEIRAA